MSAAAVGTGSVLSGRYRLGEPLASGGMGTVWRATDLLLDRSVAVKEVRLPPGLDEEARQTLRRRTIREAQAAARLRHPAIVTVYDIVEQDGRPWIVMELVPSRSLADVIRNRGPLPPAQVAAIGLRILDAMVTAQAAGVQHRDIKPANVLITDDGGRVVLTDFGIARHVGDETLTSAGLLVGSPDYLAPERARGLPSPGLAADLWSLGATMYHAVEGHRPFERDGPLPTLAAVVMDEPPPPRRAGPLRPVIDGLLVKDPAHRLDADRTRAMLQRVIRGLSPGAAMPLPTGPPTLTEHGPIPTGPAAAGHAVPAPPRAAPQPDPPTVAVHPLRPGGSAAVRGGGAGTEDTPSRPAAAAGAAAGVAAAGAAGAAAGTGAATTVGAGPEAAPAGRGATPAPPPAASPTTAPARDGEAATAVGSGPNAPATPAPAGRGGDRPRSPEQPGESRAGSIAAGTAAAGTAAGAGTAVRPEGVDGRTTPTERSVPAERPGPAERSVPAPDRERMPPDLGPAPTDGDRTGPPDGRRPGRRRTLAAAALVALILAAAAVLLPRALSDGDPPTAAGTRTTQAPAPSSGSEGTGAPASPSGAGPSASSGPSGTGPGAGSGSNPRPSSNPNPGRGPGTPAATGANLPVPVGFRRYTDPRDGFSLVLPAGWQPRRLDTRVDFEDPNSARFLRIDTSDTPKDDPYTNWIDYERQYRQGKTNYRYIGITRVPSYRPAEGWSTADWEFMIGSTHVLDRNIRVSSRRAHAIYWSTPSTMWDTAESRRIFDVAAASFVPAPVGR